MKISKQKLSRLHGSISGKTTLGIIKQNGNLTWLKIKKRKHKQYCHKICDLYVSEATENHFFDSKICLFSLHQNS